MTFSILSTVSSIVLAIIQNTGYAGVFLLMFLESMNFPIPSEIIMPFSGFLAASGVFNFWVVVLVGALGNLAGSLFSYWLGYLFRKGFIKNGRLADVEKARAWTDKFGDWAVFISRVLPVVRTFISFPLGVLGVKSVWNFSFLTLAGTLVWSGLLTWLGFVLGENWQSMEVYFRKFDYVIVILILFGIGWWAWSYFRKKGESAKIEL